MEAVARKLLRWDIIADDTRLCSLDQQVSDQVVELLLRSDEVFTLMHQRREFGGMMPLSLVSLLTGVVQSLGSRWGLFRHYWVVIKLLINVVATIIPLLYMQTLGDSAGVAAKATLSDSDLGGLRNPSPMIHAGAALLLLLVATALSVYKPRGMTPYGWCKQREERRGSQP
ncbi:MAG: hypothetical protein ACOYW9_00275 [Deinococcota bacterium]